MSAKRETPKHSRETSRVVSLESEAKDSLEGMLDRTLELEGQWISLRRIFKALAHVFIAAVGFGAAVMSFFLEKEFVHRIFDDLTFAFWLVLILEAAKVGTHIVYKKGNIRADIYHRTIPVLRLFQCMLILVSIISSLGVISLRLDRPNLETARKADIKHAEQDHGRELAALKAAHEQTVAGLRKRFKEDRAREFARLKAHYEPRIERLRRQLTAEMDNVVNGTFKGPRYRDIERRLRVARKEYADQQEALNRSGRARTDALERRIEKQREAYLKATAAADAQLREATTRIRSDGYGNDERAANPLCVATLRTINDGILGPWFNLHVGQVAFSAGFAIMLSVLLELAIFICLNGLVFSGPEDELWEEFKKKAL